MNKTLFVAACGLFLVSLVVWSSFALAAPSPKDTLSPQQAATATPAASSGGVDDTLAQHHVAAAFAVDHPVGGPEPLGFQRGPDGAEHLHALARRHLEPPGEDEEPARVEPLLAAWQDPLDRRVLEIVRGHRGVLRSTLSRQVVPDAGVVDRSLAGLLRLGAVRTRGARAGRRIYPSAAWQRFEVLCEEGKADRLQALLALLESEDLHPLLEELTSDRARVSVDGPRSKIRFTLPLNPLHGDPRR